MIGQALRYDYDGIFGDPGASDDRSGYLTRHDLRYGQRHISEAPPSNDNQFAKQWPDEFKSLDRAIEAQHAEISKLMHARNADPSNQLLKMELEAAFGGLKKLEKQWVKALKPYQELQTPSLSEADIENIEEARKILAMYKHENST